LVAKDTPRSRRPPATTLEGRENQLISSAIDLAEKQILAGTASAQVIVHFLRLGTTREQLEKAKTEKEVELLRARTDSLESAKNVETLYKQALDAMRSYSGLQMPEEDYDG
jgi:hypothetical protein